MERPGRGGRRRYVLVLLVLSSVTVITLSQREGDSGPIGDAGRFAHRVVSPVSDGASSVFNPMSDWFDGVIHSDSLKRQNSRLKRELEAARIEARRGESARAENRLLTRLSGQPYLDAIRPVVGRVVATAPGNFERTITLDRGSEKGILVGMPVVAADGLVGRVFQVWKGGCNVLLLDDPSFAVDVRMVRARTTGIAEGQAGRRNLTIDLSGPLTPAKRPRKGELAETSGLQGSTFPPTIPVGTVDSVKVSDDGLSVNVKLVALVDVANLEFVKVLLWQTGSPVPPALSATTSTTTTTTATKARPTTSTSGP
jgi:rod shape-determining protein MreC